jgi:predicted nucleotide-binding protein (sugar kinase/HSP70/actin superfamily)
VDPAAAIAKYDELWQELIDVSEKDMSRVVPVLERIAAEISTIPLKQKMEDTPKVLIVGEIYVRRDDFAVDELVQIMSKRGIIGKVSGITEWIYYCDHTRKHEILKILGTLPWYRRYFSSAMKDLIMWMIEEKWKHGVERKVKNALKTTGLIPETPHDMEEIMGNAYDHFVTDELHSEISISSGVAATALMEDYSGVINISPFACLGAGAALSRHVSGDRWRNTAAQHRQQAGDLHAQRVAFQKAPGHRGPGGAAGRRGHLAQPQDH